MALITCPDCGNKVSNLARSCIKCGRPMNSSAPGAPLAQAQSATPAAPVQPPAAGPRKTSLFTWLVAAIFVAVIASVAVEERGKRIEGHPGEQIAQAKPAKTAIRVDPGTLQDNYEDNEVRTNNELEGHYIVMTGKVSEITEMFGDPILKIPTGRGTKTVQVNLETSERSRVAKLSVGNVVTVVCDHASFPIGSPAMFGCALQ